jgi:hypothetical protein
MPVAESDTRRATIVGIAGVVVGTALIVAVLIANNVGGDDKVHTTPSKTAFDVGPATDRADNISHDQTPLLFQDPVQFQRPIYVQHLGNDPKTGWLAFDAANGTCVLTWHRESQDFTDCNGTRYPADGGSQHHYPATVQSDHVVVDLSLDATTTTTTTSTTTTTVSSAST